MNVLIVEDDLFKFSKIESIIHSLSFECSCKWIDNVHDAIKYLKCERPDKLILDMSLPSHSASVGQGSPISMPTGGIEIILELRANKNCSVETLILTQYPDIEIDSEYYSVNDSEGVIKKIFGFSSLKVAQYDEESFDWQDSLKDFLER
ncbi:hypothetical protein [Marinobacter nauticus]|uniref:hypothetical protein n=1 Tax=Marinobacter nauticus TaxID=2743 RepID=UPI0040447031